MVAVVCVIIVLVVFTLCLASAALVVAALHIRAMVEAEVRDGVIRDNRCVAPRLVHCSSNLTALVKDHGWFYMPGAGYPGGCIEWLPAHLCAAHEGFPAGGGYRYNSTEECSSLCERGMPRKECTQPLPLSAFYNCTHPANQEPAALVVLRSRQPRLPRMGGRVRLQVVRHHGRLRARLLARTAALLTGHAYATHEERWMRVASIGGAVVASVTLIVLVATVAFVSIVSPSPRRGAKPSGKVVAKIVTTELVSEADTPGVQEDYSETLATTRRSALYATARHRRRCRAPHLVDCSAAASRNLTGLVRHHAWFFMPDANVAGGGSCLEWIQGHMCHDYSRSRFRSYNACREACERGIPRLKCTRPLDLQSVYDCVHSDKADAPRAPRPMNATRRAETPSHEVPPTREEASSNAEEATRYKEAPRSAQSPSRKTATKAGVTPKHSKKPDTNATGTVWQWWFYDPLLHACRNWKDVCVFKAYATMAECAKACVF
ncbi:uncharacterized protein LOC125946842 [Dermacentor silvarum]|uniref:uncharacterized protein LOC125946842 n=1 Tax=Dermacentor silvarum TaxID=543639 RepID=UPI00210195BF|nr:uncharacterized protein LOC125946842 [Dermacentor silvarum]